MRDVLSIKESARSIGVTANRVRALCREGRIRFLETPYGRVIRKKDLDAFIASRGHAK